MAAFASNGNFATSVLNIAFSLASSSTTQNSSHGTKNFGLARPSYYTNPLFQTGTEDSDDDDFDVDFQDDFTIVSNKDEPLNSVDKTPPKSILKKPKGTNGHDKPKKAVAWHTELAHDIVNGEHVPQTELPRELWYPMQVDEADYRREEEIQEILHASANL